MGSGLPACSRTRTYIPEKLGYYRMSIVSACQALTMDILSESMLCLIEQVTSIQHSRQPTLGVILNLQDQTGTDDGHIARKLALLQIEEVDTFEDCENGDQDENDEEFAIREASLATCTHMAEIAGAWVWGISAGGSRNNVEMFSVNPQYLLQIGHEELYLRKMFSATRRQASIVETHISLAQLDQKKRLLHIAFFLYKVTSQLERLEAEYFLCVPPDECSGTFKNLTEVHGRYLLKSGAYILVPATYHPYHCAKFSIKVHASKTVSLALL